MVQINNREKLASSVSPADGFKSPENEVISHSTQSTPNAKVSALDLDEDKVGPINAMITEKEE